jgi:hypothetical protein
MESLFQTISKYKENGVPELCAKIKKLKNDKKDRKIEKKIQNALEFIKTKTDKENVKKLIGDVIQSTKSESKTTYDKMELFIPILCKCAK